MTEGYLPVTQETCKTKHRIMNVLLSILAIGAAVAFVLPLWSHAESQRAADKVADVSEEFVKHKASQETHEEHLHDSLGKIDGALEKLTDTVNRIDKAVNRIEGTP